MLLLCCCVPEEHTCGGTFDESFSESFFWRRICGGTESRTQVTLCSLLLSALCYLDSKEQLLCVHTDVVHGAGSLSLAR